MAQPQRQDDVHQDELCPPNKRYALMDANNKIDLVPWIYLGKFWHTLKEDGSKYRLTFVLNKKELTVTLDDFRMIFQLSQATNNNHEGLHYSLKHSSTLIPYPGFIKLIISHYMTAYPEISRRVRNKYYNLEHDEIVKSIFSSGKNKAGVEMKIPS
ncbi:hypothetical protein Tco_0412930 [Tanacetum coccineum]